MEVCRPLGTVLSARGNLNFRFVNVLHDGYWYQGIEFIQNEYYKTCIMTGVTATELYIVKGEAASAGSTWVKIYG